MVGAGFSQNAESKVVYAPPLPSWDQITLKIREELYQTDAEPSVAPSATDGFLQLAQEYDVTFGRTALCQLIKDTVRDDHFEPGVLHSRLLSLPWRDVFTTNWDTLLERSRTAITDRSYGLVHTTADLASALQPRIVKLHGSLPSHHPLVFTEEDYRIYPNRFAPFVNTVQQAMMETVFLLIGFSGNDPNFGHWSGWVRDNMGTSAPMIYLAGWLDLSPHQRQVLERRNVAPIDIAHHPQAKHWPEHLRHRYATEWVLHTLESGRPYDVIDWPTPIPAQVSIPDYLKPVATVGGDRPIAEPNAPSRDTPAPADSVRALLQAWKHNRSIYPGWLTFTAKIRNHLSPSTDGWEPHILSTTSEFDAIERLHALEELIWRREMLLDPMSDKLERAAADALHKVDCQRRVADGVDGSRARWADVRAVWRTIALALVTIARQRFDRERFDQRIKALSPVLDDHDDVHQRICHERALWFLHSMNFEALETVLSDWSAHTHDPVWSLRKASILVEIHRNDEAQRLVRDALDAIRSTPWDGHDLSMPSRESWALFMAGALEHDLLSQLDRTTLSNHYRRWRELAKMGADAHDEMNLCTTALQSRPSEKKPDFDLGVRTIRIQWTNSDDTKEARRTIRLTEVAALPPIANHMRVSSDILKMAAVKLVSSEPLLAMRLVLRVCTSDGDDLLKRVFSRTRVAALSKDTVDAIAQSCFDSLDYSFRRVRDQMFWVGRFAVSMEVLSRIVLRFPPDHPAFDRAIRYYSDFAIARNLRFSRSLRNLLNRCWEALPADSRSDRVLDLMKSPIVGLDDVGRTIDRHRYVDAGETVSNDPPQLPPRDDKTEDDWKQVCAILIRGLRAGTGFRENASIRLALTGLCDRLTDIEKSQIATALWHPNDTKSVGLPTGTLLHDHAFLWLPEPASGMAAKRFREKWLSEDILERVNDGSARRSIPIGSIRSMVPNPSFLDDVIGQVGIALSETKRIGHPFGLSDDECRLIVQYVDRWCNVGAPAPGGHFGDEIDDMFTKPIRYAVAGLGSIMEDVRFDADIAAKLYKKLDLLHQSKIPAFSLIAGLTKILPNRRNDLVMLMRKGLVSDDLGFSMDASAGLILWLRESTKSPTDLQPPSDDLLREIGMAIATRRNGLLHQALSIAEWIFCNGQPSQTKEIRDLTVQGLGYLLEELRYDRLADTDTDEVDVPLMRLGCARVAVALAKKGAQEPAVTGWMDAIDDDPLPEVRYAKRPES